MQTNREWLYSLDVADLSDWFDAEHEPNDALPAKNDVSGDSAGANDADAQQDSREKLEADIRDWWHFPKSNPNAISFSQVDKAIEWLDRQAAITERELCALLEENGVHVSRDGLRHITTVEVQRIYDQNVEIAELQAQVDALAAERDNLAADLLACNRERESLRRALGVAIDHAHDILQLVDEGMA